MSYLKYWLSIRKHLVFCVRIFVLARADNFSYAFELLATQRIKHKKIKLSRLPKRREKFSAKKNFRSLYSLKNAACQKVYNLCVEFFLLL